MYVATGGLISAEDPDLRFRGQKFSSQHCHTLQEWFLAKIRASKCPRCFKVRACFQSQCWLSAADTGEGSPQQCGCWPTCWQQAEGQAPAPHAPRSGSLLKREGHCPPQPPQQLCPCQRVNKPAPAVPGPFTSTCSMRMPWLERWNRKFVLCFLLTGKEIKTMSYTSSHPAWPEWDVLLLPLVSEGKRWDLTLWSKSLGITWGWGVLEVWPGVHRT